MSAVLRTPRLVAYFATWCFGVVAGAAALNGLVKARNDRDKDAKLAASLAPIPGLTIKIDINDALTAGGFLAAGQLLLSIIAFNCFVFLLLSTTSHPTYGSTSRGLMHRFKLHESRKTLVAALVSWIFALGWTIGTAIATSDYNVNRSAKTTAYLGGEKIPQATVDQLVAASGLDPHYWIHGYTKFAVISPWPLIACAIVALILTIIALRRTPPAEYATNYNQRSGQAPVVGREAAGSVDGSDGVMTEKEKADIKHSEV